MRRASPSTRQWAEAWQRSWDELQERHVPNRDLRIRALLDALDATGGQSPTVLDLACGTGTVTRRLLDSYPGARSIAVDVDPVLLTIAAATFEGDDRVRIVRADLRDPAWTDALPQRQVDAALTATALHWLAEPTVRRVYRDLARVVRPGGVLAHAEEMPLVDPSPLGAGLVWGELEDHTRGEAEAGSDWDDWWERAGRDPVLRAASKERRVVFGTNYPTEEFSPPAEWHVAALSDAGFAEARVTWRAGTAAVVAAVR